MPYKEHKGEFKDDTLIDIHNDLLNEIKDVNDYVQKYSK